MALNFPSSPSVNDIYSLGNKSWKWDGTAWNLVSSKVGYTGSAGTGGSLGYTGSIGDNSNTSFTITHGLDNYNIMTTVKEQATGYFVYPDVKYVASNQVVVEFVDPPTTNQYQIYVLGFETS